MLFSRKSFIIDVSQVPKYIYCITHPALTCSKVTIEALEQAKLTVKTPERCQ